MLRHVIIAILAILAIGCAKHPLEAPPLNKEVFIYLKIVDEIPFAKDLAGYTYCNGINICTIWIREDHYPLCIEHEVGHATHGDWHGDTPTTCGYANPPLF